MCFFGVTLTLPFTELVKLIFQFFVLQASGGYNGLSSIKMEQDGMAPLGSMKVGLAFFPFSRVVPKVHYDMCSSFPRVYLAAHTSIETMRLPHRPI